MKKLLLVLLFVFCLYSVGAQCGDMETYNTFRFKWNDNVGIFKEGSWKLPAIDFAKQKRDSFEMVHPLVRQGITFMSTLTKTSCIRKVSLLVKKDERLEVQGLVADLYLFEFFNPELNADKRQKELEQLKSEAEQKKGPASKIIGKNNYIYEPGLVVNVLTVILGK